MVVVQPNSFHRRTQIGKSLSINTLKFTVRKVQSPQVLQGWKLIWHELSQRVLRDPYGFKTINLVSSRERTLRVFVTTNNTSYQNMSYELNNNIETYLTKTFTQREFILDNSQSSSDSEFAYYDTSGVLQEPTLGPGATQTVCARLYPDQPSVTSGNGLIQLSPTICS